jgi:prepilin signal peptidase PulO-like enzyme (type II secretory pathway)
MKNIRDKYISLIVFIFIGYIISILYGDILKIFLKNLF